MPYNGAIVHRFALLQSLRRKVIGMPNSDARVVRGLNIAVLILSIISLVLCAFMFAIFGIAGVAANDPTTVSNISESLDASIEADGNAEVTDLMDHYGLTTNDVAVGGIAVVLASLGIFSVWAFICTIVPFIASILALRNYNKPEKLGGAFGWAIAGAVFSLLCGALITLVLLIISAVFINRVKNAPTAIPYGQPAYGQQPYGQVPQQPYNPNQQ